MANDRPIVGILTLETYGVQKYLPEKYDSYIAASYVKFLESSGARIIPVWIGQTEDYYARVVNHTNGIFFPGGATYFNETGGYAEAAGHIYKLAKILNQNGIHYPIWGVCLGMQVLGFAEVGTDIRGDCSMMKIAIPLTFTDAVKNSRLYGNAVKEILDTLKTEDITYNFHRYCLTEDILEKHELLSDWRILSINKDKRGLIFISSMEHKKYPFYGVQFHPEKNAYEFRENVGIPHSSSGIRAMQYFSSFFVDECRKNDNGFLDPKSEQDALIYNYAPLYTGKQRGAYEQIYVFKKTDYANVQLFEDL